MPLITMLVLPYFGFYYVAYFMYLVTKNGNKQFICLIALIMGYFFSEILKYALARPRPYEVLEGAKHLMDVGGYSLPSGHTTAAFAAFTIIGVKIRAFVTFFRIGFYGCYIPNLYGGSSF